MAKDTVSRSEASLVIFRKSQLHSRSRARTQRIRFRGETGPWNLLSSSRSRSVGIDGYSRSSMILPCDHQSGWPSASFELWRDQIGAIPDLID